MLNYSVAELRINNRFWQIEGSLPPNMTGGTAIIVIKKDDGQIQYIRHTK